MLDEIDRDIIALGCFGEARLRAIEALDAWDRAVAAWGEVSNAYEVAVADWRQLTGLESPAFVALGR